MWYLFNLFVFKTLKHLPGEPALSLTHGCMAESVAPVRAKFDSIAVFLANPLKNCQAEASCFAEHLTKPLNSLVPIEWRWPGRRRIEEQIAELSSPAEGSQPLRFDTVYARSKLAQFRVCLWRNSITWWRSPAVRTTWPLGWVQHCAGKAVAHGAFTWTSLQHPTVQTLA